MLRRLADAIVGTQVLLTSYLPVLFKKHMLTDPKAFLKNHLPEPEELE